MGLSIFPGDAGSLANRDEYLDQTTCRLDKGLNLCIATQKEKGYTNTRYNSKDKVTHARIANSSIKVAPHPSVNPLLAIDYYKPSQTTNRMSSFVKILALVPLALAASPVMMVPNQVRAMKCVYTRSIRLLFI